MPTFVALQTETENTFLFVFVPPLGLQERKDLARNLSLKNTKWKETPRHEDTAPAFPMETGRHLTQAFGRAASHWKQPSAVLFTGNPVQVLLRQAASSRL